jgi:hypothetical protein
LAAVPLLVLALAGLVRRADADRADAGRDDAAGLAADMVLAAVVSALAAVVMALVALFMASIAVDIVLADVLARVAAAVILVAAEVTLVAADDTVLAALAGVADAADELDERVLRAAAPVRADERAVVVARRAEVPVVRVPVLRAAVLVLVVLRADVLALAPLAAVLGRPAERCAALLLADRVFAELAGVRRAVARAVVCTGTEFPPS